MIHLYLRFVIKLLFWVYYRKMVISGVDNLPKTGPVILACNHPNSFLDALFVGAATHRKRIHFLARSDVFNTPFKAWILAQLSLLPVYRLQEGLENLDKNRDTFRACHDILDKDGIVLIFSEGLCIQEMRLRPLKKGTARIAFDYSREGKPLNIVPVSLNYLKPGQPQEEVLMSFGEPIKATDYAQEYAGNPGKAINEFNKVLEGKFRAGVIHIQDKSKDKEIEQIIEIEREEGKDLNELVALAVRINSMAAEQPEQYELLTQDARHYAEKLSRAFLNDRAVNDKGRWSFMLFLSTPIYWLGKILNILPYATSRWVTKKAVRRAEFYDSVFLGLLLFVTQFHSLFICIILLFIHPFLAVLIPGVLLLTGSFTVALHDPLKMNKLRRRKENLPSQELDSIVRLRQSVRARVPH
jgi:glycerol-3-phosphate O-acyltransferase/dihydroxyacetone phosphate acyltransferase